MKVLFTDGNYLHTLSIIRYLAKKNIAVHTLCLGNNATLNYSKYGYCYNNTPLPEREKEYIQYIYQLAKDNNYDLLIPVGYKSTEVISKNNDLLRKYVNTIVADYSKVSLCLNKKKVYDFASGIGVPYPKTIYPSSFDEIDIMAHNIEYPIVVKGIHEAGATIVDIAYNRFDLLVKYKNLCNKYNIDKDLPMLQEFIQEPYTYGFGALYYHGKCVNYFMHEELRSYPIFGGSGACLRSIYDKKLYEYGKSLLDGLSWHGIALVEFKKCENDYKLMEINPKLWASIGLAIECGFDFPMQMIKLVQGQQVGMFKYEINKKYHFPLSREIQHVLDRPSSIFAIFADCLNCKVLSNVDYNDLKPSLYELYTSIKRIMKKILNINLG